MCFFTVSAAGCLCEFYVSIIALMDFENKEEIEKRVGPVKI